METQTATRLVFEGNGKTRAVTLTHPRTLPELRELLARLGKRAPVITMANGSGVARVTL
jgi:hypothetical protein